MRTLVLALLIVATVAAKESGGPLDPGLAARKDAAALTAALAAAKPGERISRPGGDMARDEAEALLTKMLDAMTPADRALVEAEAKKPKPAKPEHPAAPPVKPSKR